jgi:phosphate transport system protein
MSTTRHLDREIDKLKQKILDLSALVEGRVQQAVESLLQKDAHTAQVVLDGDFTIDAMEVDIEEDCLKILALYQPVATDLRIIVSILKINNDLERIGDLAVNLADRSAYLAPKETIGIPFDFSGMATKVQAMLRSSLESFVNLDTTLARQVCLSDREIDTLHREVFEKIEAAIKKHPKDLGYLISLLTAARHLERIADHATNIAEDVIYLVEGEIPRHKKL